ncbi:MAG: hypothetical protein QXQ07_00645, partial [Thermoproteota archaeon]
ELLLAIARSFLLPRTDSLSTHPQRRPRQVRPFREPVWKVGYGGLALSRRLFRHVPCLLGLPAKQTMIDIMRKNISFSVSAFIPQLSQGDFPPSKLKLYVYFKIS